MNCAIGTLIVTDLKPVTVEKDGKVTVQEVLNASGITFNPETQIVLDGDILTELDTTNTVGEGITILVVAKDLMATDAPAEEKPAVPETTDEKKPAETLAADAGIPVEKPAEGAADAGIPVEKPAEAC